MCPFLDRIFHCKTIQRTQKVPDKPPVADGWLGWLKVLRPQTAWAKFGRWRCHNLMAVRIWVYMENMYIVLFLLLLLQYMFSRCEYMVKNKLFETAYMHIVFKHISYIYIYNIYVHIYVFFFVAP